MIREAPVRRLVDPEFVVIGGGAIGGIIAAGLAEQGLDVLVVDRSQPHVDAIREGGLVLVDRDGRRAVPLRACLPAEMPSRLTRVLVAVRCVDTRDVLDLIEPRLAADGYVVSLQNGLNPLLMQRVISARRTIGAFVNFQAACTEPGIVTVGRAGTLYIGEIDGTITERVGALAETFTRIRPTIVSPNIMGLLWSKLAYSSILTATALVDADVREILPVHRALFLDLAVEALQLARLESVAPESFDVWVPDELLSRDDSVRTRGFQRIVDSWQDRELQRTGTWRDLAIHHRMPDVDEKIGWMLRMAAGRLAMPVHAMLLHLVHEVAVGTRSMSWRNLEELADACERRRLTNRAGGA